ncbi:2OG-Fe(II) oxygenase [Pseudidiomarina sediminum]|uniref:2OG-Fe(II) oxygenase n=1 Tax=Pseudidiomarina sediminum TaxID=431675 RepID=A0A432Z9I0_9GAMM|nr:2OG-Fe(II) oxygenase [Pseudidiomarina sediminum]MBY6063727.1 2OG-Fe(II) oxygenase [Pseudidiomarina sediminum]RUO74540.1 2OG-Fe(II) oxygenase [Pseudidiomarina sediminum]
MAQPTQHILCQDPLVYIIDDFFTDSEAKQLQQAAASHMDRAKVSSDKEGVLSNARTNQLAWIRHTHDMITTGLGARIAAQVGLPLANAESFQVIHYAEQQEYRAHFDAYNMNTERGQRCTARGGQRLFTALGYINSPAAGGSTYFPKLDINVAAKPGRLLVFENVVRGTTDVHPKSLHAGMPVTEGEKWAFNLWFHEREFV